MPGILRVLLWSVGVVAALYLIGIVYLAVVLRWEDEQTVGLRYYGKSPGEREAFKKRLRLHARLLSPLIRLHARMTRVDFRRARIIYQGVSFPSGSCDATSLARAAAYQPRPEDVFVVTQMKCGTTWMEHIVYQVLHRGQGRLVESGTALYAVAPWLEGRKSVPVEEAQPVGTERASRIIKTHLPAALCPWSDRAKYIYVARHPVSCYASCVDFVATNVGEMAPSAEACEEWFRSPDLMWWGTWTDHVKGWWARSGSASNVLFVHFEEMKRDLGAVASRVAAFLGMSPLSATELSEVVRKCGFAYMQEHQDIFEMHPPHILQTNAALFVKGSAERHKDVADAASGRIAAWAAEAMKSSDYPMARHYPDLAETRLSFPTP